MTLIIDFHTGHCRDFETYDLLHARAHLQP